MRLGINARFLGAPLGGVQRFARETTSRLLETDDVVLFVPALAAVPDEWSVAARVVRGRMRGHTWEHLELAATAEAHCDVLLNPANTAPVAGPPRVLVLHDVFPIAHPEWYAPRFALWYRLTIPIAARRAAHILAPSAYSADTIRRVLGIERAAVSVVPQGAAPFDAPADADSVARVVARFDIPGPYVLASGAGDARKNIAFAMAVMDAYARSYGATPLLVVTGAASRRVYGSAAGTAHDNVMRTRHVSDDVLRALYTGASAVLAPSLDEGFGRAPLEALCCGAPCIVADHAASAEVLADTPALRLPLDAGAWAAALHSVIESRERVPADIRQRLCERWSWDDAVQVLRSACRTAAGCAAAPAGTAV